VLDAPQRKRLPSPLKEPYMNIDTAIEAAGGKAALARRLAVTHQAVCLWSSQGYAPPKRAMQIAEISGVPGLALVSPAVRKMVAALTGE
jgi:DNA-binding transcriptional regulator YdaS (Cro superfamily)